MNPQEPNAIVKYAVLEIARSINQDGLDPQAALTKAAKDMDLNVHFIKRASEAINVALHYNHFKKHADARDADFPITDASKAVTEIFGDTEKTAAEFQADTFPSAEKSEYQINYAKILTNPGYKRAFVEMHVSPEDRNSSFPTSLPGLIEKTSKYIQRLEKQQDDVLTKKAGAAFNLNRSFSKVVSEFSKDAAARVPFDEFESQVFAKFGEAAVPYVDLIHKVGKISEERGVHDASYRFFDESNATKAFSDMWKSAQEFVALQKEAIDAEYNLKFEKDFMKEAHQVLGSLRPKEEPVQEKVAEETALRPEDVEDPVLKVALKKKLAAEDGKGSGPDLGVFSPLAKLMGGGSGGGVKETRLDSLSRTLMLQELLMSDPIISKLPPQQVASHYEQMLRLAPELAKEKEVVRSQLRNMGAAQALSPFDAQQLATANTDLMKQRMYERGDIQPR